jgi:FkbM family methyltransferase
MSQDYNYVRGRVTISGREESIVFRHGTMDEFIIRQIVEHNEYGIRGPLPVNMKVIDIGAHIGTFSWFCHQLGAGEVRAFEALAENHTVAAINLGNLDGVSLTRAAVWRSDVDYPLVLRSAGHTANNTGDGNVTFTSPTEDGAEEIPAISLDDIIGDEEVDLIKIDCESSEWPILLTATKLDQVKAIVGEFHEINGEYDLNQIMPHAQVRGMTSYTIEALIEHLALFGFTVEHLRFVKDMQTKEPSNMGLFLAVRK